MSWGETKGIHYVIRTTLSNIEAQNFDFKNKLRKIRTLEFMPFILYILRRKLRTQRLKLALSVTGFYNKVYSGILWGGVFLSCILSTNDRKPLRQPLRKYLRQVSLYVSLCGKAQKFTSSALKFHKKNSNNICVREIKRVIPGY